MSASLRIISLLPSATELICALGLEQNLVGRSHECDYPESVKALPVCTEANIQDGLSSGEIDRKVKEILTDALSLYAVKKDVIKDLQPDIVITQDQCDVCAVALPEVERALQQYLDKPAQIISLQPDSIDDMLADIKRVASTLNVADAGDALVEDLEDRINIIRHKLKFIDAKPTVACIEWLDPLMVSGNWIPELVSIAGGTPVFTEAGKHSPYVDWDAIRLANPDIMVLMPCGFGIDRTMREINLLLDQPGFADLKAIKNNRLYIADGNQYFNRPGPRLVDSLEIMAEIINPKQFIFGFEGNGWIKFSV